MLKFCVARTSATADSTFLREQYEAGQILGRRDKFAQNAPATSCVRIHDAFKQSSRHTMTTAERHDIQHSASAGIPRYGFVQGWKAFFHYTKRVHLLVLLPAILLSVVAGGLTPAMAFLFGKFLDNFSDFGSGYVDGTTFMQRAKTSLYPLLGIGGATFLLKGGLFGLWLTFGELQARNIREILFRSLLDRDIEWYEARTTGVGTLLSRFQRYDIIRPTDDRI
jgi:hypothetical protein